MERTMRQMHFVACLQAQNCTTLPASWRYPEARTDTYAPEYYQHIARVLEAGKFDMGFFDDRLAMPNMYGGDHAHTVQYGIRCVKLDPIACLMTMAAATTRLGLGATYSTTSHEPFHVARLFQSLDFMTKGHIGWNVVTSVNDNEARNRGRTGAMEHDSRYDRADAFMQVVLGYWESWDNDAIVADKAQNFYAHPDKVRLSGLSWALSVVAGTVHRAAFPAGPPRDHSGGDERARTRVRCPLGRTTLCGVSHAGGGATALRGDEGSRGRRRTESRRDENLHVILSSVRGDEG
jgi:alkanesulfonate monooxygenase SsuD/methylene tetrahydromethanopterin reductase-like flavin-dependent oxidoreductase (luciferase family)